MDIFILLVKRGFDFRRYSFGVETAMPFDPALYSLIPDNIFLNILIIVSSCVPCLINKSLTKLATTMVSGYLLHSESHFAMAKHPKIERSDPGSTCRFCRNEGDLAVGTA